MSRALLELRGLVRRFGGLNAVDQVTLEVSAREICALIGPNGAGKTTLVNLIAGSLVPDSGSIWFDSEDVTALPVHARASRGLTRSFQIVSIFPRLSVTDNAWLAIQGAHADRMAWRSRDPVRPEKIVALLERCGLADRRHQAAGTLSHGDQRRLELALAMASQPRLLLLDEPMAGIGPGETESIARLIEDAARQAAVILVEHDMDTVFRLAHRVVVLQQGRVIANGSPEEVRRDPDVRRAYLGEAESA
jgi:branched-chain amino acid transport system ATP-binding protein